MAIEDDIRNAARAAGIDAVGFAAAEPLDREASGLGPWLRDGHHGGMAWMARNPERRLDPRRVLAGARSVIAVAVNYFHPGAADHPDHRAAGGRGRISRYAWGGDYHKLLKRRLLQLLAVLRREWPELRARAYVDTGPVLEKIWARRAGIGWVGKHGNLITRARGSWVFLGELLVDRGLAPDAPATGHCGKCRRCIDACPTAAIVAPAVVDARRCIAYLTIEHRGAIEPALRPGMQSWIFGCDICQEVCPWNKFQTPSPESRFAPRAGNLAPDLTRLAGLDREAFDRRFQGSAVRRAGWTGLVRNVMVALGNAGAAASARPALVTGLAHPAPLVRAHAAWAAGRLGARSLLRARRGGERDARVREEIDQALGA